MFDLNGIDDLTFMVALTYAVIRHFRAQSPKPFASKQTRRDFLHGTALFPLAVLTLSLFSPRLTSALLHTNKLILSVAGFVAILAVLQD